jgi:hypothetical protein
MAMLSFDYIVFSALAPYPEAPPELDITIFSPNDQLVFDMCLEVVRKLNKVFFILLQFQNFLSSD